MQSTIERAIQLKQQLVDFVYDAEDELAIALETNAAAQGKKNSYGIKQQNLTVDLFLTTGKVENQTPLEMFLNQAEKLSTEDKSIVELWARNFIGLFEIQAIKDDQYQLMNWLTAKTYQVYSHSEISAKETERWQPGEIVLAIIAPINKQEWFFFSDRIIKGRLSQPKLAVAVGEFRDNYPNDLYADAPELLEQAWDSVAVYHQEFVDYMGKDKITLPGYKLNQKIGELQQLMSRKKLAEAGIDDSKSISAILAESGKSEAEFAEAAQDLGADAKTVASFTKDKASMVTPKVDLPPEIKQAESVTVFSHPRWGQMFLPTYEKFTSLLEDDKIEDLITGNLYVRRYLEQPQANYYVWQQLAMDYPQALTQLLAHYCSQDDFELEQDLKPLMLKHHKSIEPKLPAIANVPQHLNDLFEMAVAQVQKTKSKAKTKKKKKGFK